MMVLQLFIACVCLIAYVFPCTLGTLLSRPSFRTQASQRHPDERAKSLQFTRQGRDFLQTPMLHTTSHRVEPTGARKTAVLEISRLDLFGFPFYFTYIAFGSPPQPFALFIDLEYGAAVVRAVGCANDCGQRVFAYNYSASSTSHDENLRVGMPLAGHTGQGTLYRDDAHIVSLEAQNMTLGAIDTFYGENLLLSILAEFCDG